VLLLKTDASACKQQPRSCCGQSTATLSLGKLLAACAAVAARLPVSPHLTWCCMNLASKSGCATTPEATSSSSSSSSQHTTVTELMQIFPMLSASVCSCHQNGMTFNGLWRPTPCAKRVRLAPGPHNLHLPRRCAQVNHHIVSPPVTAMSYVGYDNGVTGGETA
jgi:hypothetical protein